MLTPVECIALRTVRLSDSKNLLSAWSRQAGRVTFAIPAGTGREARRRRAITTPLSTFEGVCDLKPERDIQTIRDVMPMAGSPAMGMPAMNGMTAMFLAEVLDNLLRKSSPDDELSDFLFSSVTLFAGMDGRNAANFHIVFLSALAYYLGFGPDTGDYRRGAVFDLREGRFTPSAPLHSDRLEGDEVRMMMLVARTPVAHPGRLPLSREARNRALDILLRYFSLHLIPLTSLKSLDILRTLL